MDALIMSPADVRSRLDAVGIPTLIRWDGLDPEVIIPTDGEPVHIRRKRHRDGWQGSYYDGMWTIEHRGVEARLRSGWVGAVKMAVAVEAGRGTARSRQRRALEADDSRPRL